MLRSPEPLLVYPVPFAALDARGMPAAAVRFDPPTGRNNEVHFIGCTRENTLLEKRARAEGRQSLYATSFRYELTAQAIPHTDYHVQRIRHGELIAADEATARRARVSFVPPATAFERARFAAIASWEQQYGVRPPVEKWPAMSLVRLDGDSSPSTAPAHEASLRAQTGAPPAAPGQPPDAPANAAPPADGTRAEEAPGEAEPSRAAAPKPEGARRGGAEPVSGAGGDAS